MGPVFQRPRRMQPWRQKRLTFRDLCGTFVKTAKDGRKTLERFKS